MDFHFYPCPINLYGKSNCSQKFIYFSKNSYAMKKIIIIVTAFTFIQSTAIAQKSKSNTPTTAQLKTFKKASDYNNFIVDEQLKVQKRIQEFSEIIQDSTKTMQQKLAACTPITTQAKKSKLLIMDAPAFKSGEEFKNTAITLFESYEKISATDFVTIVKIVTNPNITEEQIIELNTIQTELTENEKKLDESFINAQKAFAEANDLLLE